MNLGLKVYHSGKLYLIARSAYERTLQAESDNFPGQDDALIAIIFATATLEAFINELSDIAELSKIHKHKEEKCVFRSKPATHSGETCHLFRLKVATHSG